MPWGWVALLGRLGPAAAVLLTGVAPAAKAESQPERTLRWDLGASLEARWGIQTRDGDTQMAIVWIEPQARVSLPGVVELTGIARIGGDLADALEPGKPYKRNYARGTQPLFAGDRVEIELRELYADAKLGPVLVRLGKQQVVWGEADGLRVLDVVNPQDLREFILPDFQDSRIPLWIANFEIPFRNWLVQILWVPDPTYNLILGLDEVSEPIEPYAFTTPQFRPRVPPRYQGLVDVDLLPAERPEWKLSNSDYGGRVSTVLAGWDVSVNAIRQFDDTPFFDLGFVGLEVIDGQLGARISVQPRYARRTVVGTSFGRSFRSITLRGDFAVSIDRTFTTDPAIEGIADLGDPSNFRALRSNEVSYLLGLDWYGIPQGVASLQFFQTVITDYNDRMLRDRWTSIMTVAIQRRFWNGRLVPELLCYNGFQPFDGLARLRVSYEAWDGVYLSLGADLFYGSQRGVFGQFDGNDRIVLGFKAGF